MGLRSSSKIGVVLQIFAMFTKIWALTFIKVTFIKHDEQLSCTNLVDVLRYVNDRYLERYLHNGQASLLGIPQGLIMHTTCLYIHIRDEKAAMLTVVF